MTTNGQTSHATSDPAAMIDGGPIAVTGATGFVGRYLVRALVEQGHAVRALARDAEKAARVLPDGVEIVEGEVLGSGSEDRLASLVRGAKACVHLIGIIQEAGGGQTFQRMHVEATEAVVRACERAGVPRFLHMSALGVRPDGPAEYQRTKAAGEKIVRYSDLDWTIFRPGLILGPDGDFWQQMKGWCEGRELPHLFLPYFLRVTVPDQLPRTPDQAVPKIETPAVAPVGIGDLVSAFVAALDRREAVGEIYPLVGATEVSWPQMLRAARDRLPQANKSLRPIGLPGNVVAIKARVFKILGMASLFPFDEGMALMGAEDSLANTTKAEKHLGFDPAGFDAVLDACVAG